MDIDLRQFDDIPPVTRQGWEAAVAKALGASTLDRLRAVTLDGIAIPTLGAPRGDRAPLPGRGAGVSWSIVQRVDFEDPARTNERILEELTGGADAIDLVLPNSDTSFTAASSAEMTDPEKILRVFEGVYLDMITVHLTSGPDVLHIVKRLLTVVSSFDRAKMPACLHLGADSTAGLIGSDGKFTRRYRETGMLEDLFRQFLSAGLNGTVFTASGQKWHAAGASELQQLSIAIATGVEFIVLWSKRLRDHVPLREFVKRIEFRLVADQNQFLTIAKLRAFRRLWALVLDAYGVSGVPAFVHAEPAWRMMTRRDPWVNILRSTIASFSAAVGGADAITSVPHTALLGRPDAAARRLSRNVQTVLMDESNLHRVADPAAGSGAVEDLTDSLAEGAWEEFRRIEREGGLAASLAAGAIQGRIAGVEARRRDLIAKRRIAVTGTSTYPMLKERAAEVEAAGEGWNPAPGAMRLAEPWEALRDRSDAALAANGRRPAVFLANLGAVAAFTARATWAKNLFEAGGIEAVGQPGFADAEACAKAFSESGAAVACLCSDDATYGTMAAEVATALKTAGARHVMMAGRPKQGDGGFDLGPVDQFVHEGLDMLALLTDLHERLATPAPAGH